MCEWERRNERESEWKEATDERAVSERYNVTVCERWLRDGVMKTTRECVGGEGERGGGRERVCEREARKVRVRESACVCVYVCV